MNNGIIGELPVNSEENRIKKFRSAQNRAALPMFIMFFIELGASVLMIIFSIVFPDMKNDAFKYELMQALLYLSYMAIPVFTFGLISGKRPHKYFSFKRGRKHTVAAGLATLAVVYFAQLVAVILTEIAGKIGLNFDAASFNATSDPALTVLRIVYLAVFPAILEELLTRGIILGELLPYGKGFAVIMSGLLFGFMHMNPVQLPFAFIAGSAMAYAVICCGTLRVSVAVHFINNFLSVLFMSLSSFISEDIAFYIEAVVSAVIFAAGTAAAIWLMKHKNEIKEEYNGAFCTECGEELKVDLREGAFKKVSPLIYVYIGLATFMTLFAMIASNLT